MLSIELIRRDAESVKAGLRRRHEDTVVIDQVLELDAARRRAVAEGDNLRARRNDVSKQISRMKEKPQELIEEMRQAGDRIKAIDDETRVLDQKLADIMLGIPNLPLPDVQDGSSADDNVVVRSWGEVTKKPFPVVPHWDLGERLGIIDLERGARISGARFFMLKGLGARLERALIWWFLDVHTREHGYTEIYPPYLVKSDVLLATGNLPKFGDNLYHDAEEDLWLVPTAEAPLTNMHRDEILEAGDLPRNYTAYTPCFRKEKTAAGRDVRGIKRVHQFDKVEMYKYTTPETSDQELERMVGDVEDLLKRLGLTYRVLKLCAGDIGFQSARTYDLEVWAPGSGEWLEVSSCSTCVDFQARRANTRYRPKAGGRTEFLHTLNGSGLALPRIVIAILENYQQPDGSVVVPDVLRPYMGVDVIKAAGK